MAQIVLTKAVSLSGNMSDFNQFNFDNVTLPSGASWTRWKVECSAKTWAYEKVRDKTKSHNLSWDNWYTDFDLLLINSVTPRLYFRNTASGAVNWTATLTLEYDPGQFAITYSAGTGGSLTGSANSAAPGTVITLYPTANTGYQFSSWSSSPSVTISNNKFTMPASAVTITANFSKITYTITKAANPAAGGTVTTSANSAVMGTSITLSQTPNAGYYFNGWTTNPTLTISGGAFTMPANNVSITANYLRRSTASLNKTTLTGGDSATLTISTEKTTYSHQYKLSFGTNMETSWVTVAAGTTSVSISIPASWSNYIPAATSKTGGTLVLKTFNGNTEIGSYTISSLTYAVPASAKPSIGTITKSIARTIGGVTYANIGEIYTQGKCGVRIQTSASGSYSSTISSLAVTLSGYSGSNYNKTVSAASIDFTTGLLTIAGSVTITVTVTDSRGRTATATTSITVTAYNNPSGTLSAWRVNASGTTDTMGTYAKYAITTSYSAIGSNTLTVKLTSQGSTATNPASTGNLMPSSRQTFSIQSEYTITLTLQDAFGTVTITSKVPSARFIIYVNANGDKIGFMKAASKSIPSGKDSTFEISGTTQVYIGDTTLEQYIRNIVNNM